jgi:hypothetical protein
MVEVKFLKDARTNHSHYHVGETAGFEEDMAKVLVAAGVAVITRQHVPDTAGVGSDVVASGECPHCGKAIAVTAANKLEKKVEIAADGRMQPAKGGSRQAETRAS